jgi:glycosyltransferase involved in cell wall biosynthesis
MTPYFSVITPSYNQGTFLEGCLQSVVAQGDPEYEHLIFDNCSTDSTSGVVAKFSNVHFVSEPDRGQSDAVNKGFLAARGEIICWLNSDDAYPMGLFTKLRQVFADPAVSVVFGDVEQIAYDGSPSQIARAEFRDRLDLVRWWSRQVKIHQPAVFFRTGVRKKTGLLREDLHYAMDYEYWWRMSEHHKFLHVPDVLAIQHRQPDSKTVVAWNKVYVEREKIFSPFYGFIDGGNPRGLDQEKRRAMSDRYLGEAFAVCASDRGQALALLGKSIKEFPISLLNFGWCGVLRRCLK